MSTLNKRLETTLTNIQKLQKEYEFLKEIAPNLPDLNYKTIYVGPYKADLWLAVEVETVEDVMPLLEKFPAISMGRFADSCTSFCPYESLTEKELERLEEGRGDFESVMPVYLEAEVTKDNELTACWFSQIANVRIFFNAEIKQNAHLISWYWQKVDIGQGKFMKVDRFRYAWKDATAVKFWGQGLCPRKIFWPSAFTVADLLKYESLKGNNE